MSNRHPLVRMWEVLSKDEVLASMTNNLIFTNTIPETYRKKESAPFIRVTQILLQDTLFRDGDSEYYRFFFAVETFSTSINKAYEINQRVIDIVKSLNGRCYTRNLDFDKDVGLYNEMIELQIILPKKET